MCAPKGSPLALSVSLAFISLRPDPPFYTVISREPKLAPITLGLPGLNPMRPVSFFEMAIIALTEQHISLAAARAIRARIVERFGEQLDGEWIFPEPRALSEASHEDLQSCGLSRPNAHYSDQAWAEQARRPAEEVARIMRGEWPTGWVNPQVEARFLARWREKRARRALSKGRQEPGC